MTGEARTTKTQLASTMADLMKERDVSEREASVQREVTAKLKEEVAVLRTDKELAERSTADLKEQLEVSQSGSRVQPLKMKMRHGCSREGASS